MSGSRVVVLGYIVRGPLGGMTWHHLHYVLGLHQLGHDVWFMEDSDDYPSCYDPSRGVTDADPTYGLRYATALFDRVGLGDRWAYHDAHTAKWHGPATSCAVEVARSADVVVNVSGVNPLRDWFSSTPGRVLVDTDPVFTQIRHRTDEGAHGRAEAHSHFVTFASNIERSTCSVPSDGFPWRPTRQPVALDWWDVTQPSSDGAFTSILQWESYPPVEHEGTAYGTKSATFPAFESLPSNSGGERLELALGSQTAPRDRLRSAGWSVVDPLSISEDPWTYQDYIRASKGEFGVAKQAYVSTRSGWFSERTANYLAAGRPAVVQDTGFSDWLPSGEGLFAVSDVAEATEAIEHISGDLERQSVAARRLVADHFDAREVLGNLIDQVG